MIRDQSDGKRKVEKKRFVMDHTNLVKQETDKGHVVTVGAAMCL